MMFSTALTALVLALALLAALPSSYGASATFPMYSSYAGRPYRVSYDARSIRLNDQPVMFMSGSIHYPRSTPGMWPGLMKAAAADGLNMIEIYVFWNYHEQVEGTFDWSERGNLTLFLDAIKEAGLFANLRIGPYVCAEWDYGGIPTWLGYVPGMRFRSYNQQWRDAVQSWMSRVVNVTRDYFADRGGPIVLAQVENELNGADERYVQWNGDMANALGANVPWIMCNGQAANNTINTCNGNDCAGFINSNGQSGRILIDQPAMWTENEGWFQDWGDHTYPNIDPGNDRSPQDMAFVIARWFARGGSHMNYYMYHGGNHYGLTAGSGLANKYADGVNFHSDTLPNEPKKSHLMRLHEAIARVSADLLAKPAQYKSGTILPYRASPGDAWKNGTDQVAFTYGSTVFVESGATIPLQVLYQGAVWDFPPTCVLIISDGKIIYNSSDVAPAAVERVNKPLSTTPLRWQAWREGPYSVGDELAAGLPVRRAMAPLEQLNITGDLTEYMWYVATRAVSTAEDNATLSVDLASANALLVYWDAQYKGSCYNWDHRGNTGMWRCTVALGAVTKAEHSLALLSVSLGNDNGMSPEEVGYKAHYKGVATSGKVRTAATDFTEGMWTHRPYLTGEFLEVFSDDGRGSVQWTEDTKALVGQPLVWWTAEFPKVTFPSSGQYALLVDMTGMGRGHCYVNGRDIGRYWLVLDRQGQYPTQWLYHIPPDWVHTNMANRITCGEELGGDPSHVNFVISTMQPKQDVQARLRRTRKVTRSETA